MASSSNNLSVTLQLPNFPKGFPKIENTTTYLLWPSTVVPILKAHEVLGIVDDSETVPYLLSWINISLSPSVLSTICGLHTSKKVWYALSTRFASQSRSRISHLKRQLQGLQQGSKSCIEYLRLAKSIGDQLAAIETYR
jgi:hypothetical protein